MKKKIKWWQSPLIWVQTTYFAEGYPYTIVHSLPEILFKEMGASLEAIGLTSLFHLPWNLKFLWGPLLDEYGTKRAWLLGIEILLTTLLVLTAFLVGGKAFFAISVCMFFLAILAATHDIAIDGFYLEALDLEGQAKYVGYRAMAWRVSAIFVSGPVVIFIGKTNWVVGFFILATLMGALLAVHWISLPKIETEKNGFSELLSRMKSRRFFIMGFIAAALIAIERQTHFISEAWGRLVAPIQSWPVVGQFSAEQWIGLLLFIGLLFLLVALPRLKRKLEGSATPYAKAYIDFLSQKKVGLILAFIIFFRAGESFLMKMKYAFLKDVVGLSMEQYGIFNGTYGVMAGIIATLLGGWLISKHGLRKWIWPFVCGQNVLNLLYMWLAYQASQGPVSTLATVVVIGLEQFGAGLGTAVFMVYILRACHPEHKAAHMAILTALMSLSFTVAGVLSGFMASALGFTTYFGVSFVITVPAMLLIFYIPYLDGREANGAV